MGLSSDESRADPTGSGLRRPWPFPVLPSKVRQAGDNVHSGEAGSSNIEPPAWVMESAAVCAGHRPSTAGERTGSLRGRPGRSVTGLGPFRPPGPGVSPRVRQSEVPVLGIFRAGVQSSLVADSIRTWPVPASGDAAVRSLAPWSSSTPPRSFRFGYSRSSMSRVLEPRNPLMHTICSMIELMYSRPAASSST